MEEYSEVQTYRHLLSVAESIINSLQTDPNIITKYHQLKSALLQKASNNDIPSQQAHQRKLLNAYKYVASSLLDIMAQFQAQIETTMHRVDYNKKVIAIVKEWELRLQDLKTSAQALQPKTKLIAKEENSALSYYCAEFDGKLENLGLLIEVHKKMHEIIEQAAQGESQRARREEALEDNLHDLEREVGEVREAQGFVEQHRLAERQFKEFKVWSGKMAALLFQ